MGLSFLYKLEIIPCTESQAILDDREDSKYDGKQKSHQTGWCWPEKAGIKIRGEIKSARRTTRPNNFVGE